VVGESPPVQGPSTWPIGLSLPLAGRVGRVVRFSRIWVKHGFKPTSTDPDISLDTVPWTRAVSNPPPQIQIFPWTRFLGHGRFQTHLHIPRTVLSRTKPAAHSLQSVFAAILPVPDPRLDLRPSDEAHRYIQMHPVVPACSWNAMTAGMNRKAM
jgi:hypothetical protein